MRKSQIGKVRNPFGYFFIYSWLSFDFAQNGVSVLRGLDYRQALWYLQIRLDEKMKKKQPSRV
jgi:hypothetical protein